MGRLDGDCGAVGRRRMTFICDGSLVGSGVLQLAWSHLGTGPTADGVMPKGPYFAFAFAFAFLSTCFSACHLNSD